MTEVHLTVTEEAQGAVGAGWRYLFVALAALAAVAVLTVSVLGSAHGPGSASSPPASTPRAAARSSQVPSAPTSSPCVAVAGYGGLGARASSFDANNNNTTGPAEPTPGPAWYVVTSIAKGCVTAFSLQDERSPPLTAQDLLSLVSHPYLPRDATRIVNGDSCAVWKSVELQRATGKTYATATAAAQLGSDPGRAEIQATSTRDC